MPMTSKAAAFLITLASILTGVSGILIVAEPSSLGLSEETLKMVAGWCALGGSVFSIVVISIRKNLLPGVETGEGMEPKPGTDSITVETTHTPSTGGTG